MKIEQLSLFSTKKELLLFLAFCLFIFSYSLLIEYNNYKNLTKFDSSLVVATVTKQYTKTKLQKNGRYRTYQVLQCKADKGFTFYTTAKKDLIHVKQKVLDLEIWTKNLTFYEYMNSFFAYSKIISINNKPNFKQKLNNFIEREHTNEDTASIYKALYTAYPLERNLQQTFSTLGISHILAISGFHLGVLSALLYFLFKIPYRYLQNRYFPYRSYNVDSFVFISFILLTYLLFLDTPASLLRAYVMLVIGFILYDRGFKVISMMTLFLTAVIILSFAPRLVFSLGFWLSVSGVFYIFLFLIYFKNIHKVLVFILLPIWVYIMMLPHSLYIFNNFSLFHPLSILWTTLFSIFYPLSILLHLIGFGNLLDESLIFLINLSQSAHKVNISTYIEVLFVLISILSIWKKQLLIGLILFSSIIFTYAIYNQTTKDVQNESLAHTVTVTNKCFC